MHNRQNLLLVWAFFGSVLFFVQLAIWNQLNDRLAPTQQIQWRTLSNVYIWFQKDGLLAQHERLYPDSRLRTAFKVLWGTFWVLAACSIASR
jgi:hypothetical protein